LTKFWLLINANKYLSLLVGAFAGFYIAGWLRSSHQYFAIHPEYFRQDNANLDAKKRNQRWVLYFSQKSRIEVTTPGGGG
jgi:hypothetical protein